VSAPRPKIPRKAVHGVLLLDKPLGLSSNHALQAAKRLLCAEKAGHTGTLDPLATGLLPLCFGEATKFSQTLLEADKAYEAHIKLGVRTDTYDAEGAVIATCPVNVDEAEVLHALARFRGEIEQMPPMHSALKVAGKPLYAYAREGVTLERKARKVVISSLELVSFEHDVLRVQVDCGKGTYIRSLAEDIGQALGCGAHLAGLRRTRIGPFGLTGAVSLDTLERTEPAQRESLLAPPDALLAAWPKLTLTEAQAGHIQQGRRIPWPELADGFFRLYHNENFLGLARAESGVLHPERLLRTEYSSVSTSAMPN